MGLGIRIIGGWIAIGLLTTYQDALADYHLHPESKFSNGDAFDRGTTERRHVHVRALEHIGKEANQWEAQYFLGANADAQIEYGSGVAGMKAFRTRLADAVKTCGLRWLAREVGMSHKDLSEIISGKVVPRVKTIQRLVVSTESVRDNDIEKSGIIAANPALG